MVESVTSKRKMFSYLTVEYRGRILRFHKFWFSVANLTDCFNVNKRTICPIVCMKTFTRTAVYRNRELITAKHKSNLVGITLHWHCPKSLCVLRRKDLPNHSYFLLLGWRNLDCGKCHLVVNQHWTSDMKRHIDSAQEFKSHPAYFWRLVFSLINVCSAMNLGNLTRENFSRRLVPRI